MNPVQIIVRDGLIPEPVIDQALASVLPPDSLHWKRGSESGGGPHRVGRAGPTFLRLADDHPSMLYMEAAVTTTVSRLYEDPRSDLSYGGLFQMLPGAELSPHRDHNTVGNKKYRRRCGILLFLNDPDGGAFQLWDERGPTNTVDPVRGRLVIFDVNAYHAVTPVDAESRRLTLGLHVASRVLLGDDPPHPNMTWLVDDHPEVFAP